MSEQLEILRRALRDRYEIQREAGAGGMSTVYLARDLKHERDVALKVLRPELAAAVGPPRFLREIRIAASLQHPNILPLYDSGEAEGFLYYVMPFVDGPTLQDRLDETGAMAVEETLTIAREIGDALEYAHRKGLVHRDIKPGNILFSNGRAVLTDFGLATAVTGGEQDRLTQTGMVLGTPLYMSPEQAAGKQDVDSKSDLYSLGCVVYEMLSGDPPFTGSDARAVLARHVTDPVPPIRTVRPELPPGVDRVLRRALAKVPADRHPSASALIEALSAPETATSTRRRWIPVSVLAVLVVAALVWVFRPGQSNARLAPGRSIRVTALNGPEYSGSLAPDSKFVAFAHSGANGTMDIFTKLLDGGQPQRLTDDPGDELLPRWSPDGAEIAYVKGHGTQCDIYRIPRTGGTPRPLVETGIPYLLGFWDAMYALGSAPWSPDGRSLVYSRYLDTGGTAISQVDLESQETKQLTFPEEGARDLSASWSFDGEQIVFTRVLGDGVSGLWLVSPAGGEARPLEVNEFNNGEPSFLPGDEHVVYGSNRSGIANMWAIHIESGIRSRLTSGGGNDMHPSVTKDGLTIYSQFSHRTNLHVLEGETGESHKLTSWTQDNFGGRFSPNGEKIAYHSTRDGDANIYVRSVEPADREELPLTDDPANDVLPAWSPDGEWIAFVSNREGHNNLYLTKADGSLKPRRLSEKRIPIPTLVWGVSLSIRWTPDGESIGFVVPGPEGPSLWIIDRDGSNLRRVKTDVLRFDWYGDRNRIVYSMLAQDGLELRAASLTTNEGRLLYRGPHTEMIVSPRWNAVAFVQSASHFNQQLYRLRLEPPDTEDGLPRAAGELEQLTDGQGIWHVHNGGWSPDGEQIVYTQDTDSGDIYMLENE